MNDQIKKKYMNCVYNMSYGSALYDAEHKTQTLYFDVRYWTTKDIKEFFEDLCYCDNRTWECIVFNLSKHNKPAATEKRIKKWMQENDEALFYFLKSMIRNGNCLLMNIQ